VGASRVVSGGTRRQEREQDFYDRGYGSGEYLERPATRFYSVARAAFARYDQRVGAGLREGTEVLECGCGVGDYAISLARRGARVVGVDISPVATQAASEAAEAAGVEERAEFLAMDCEALGFPDDRFDLVCGEGILHHLDLDRALGEIARVLRPAGTAVFLEPLGHNPLINLYRRRTPDQRTVDEHPVRVGDLDRARRHFERVDAEFHTLLPLAALPFRRSRRFDRLVRRLDGADHLLFRAIPWLRRHAWITVIRLEGAR
jgi:SAM-dependent methyltransferase